jgi:hypothetical protein
MKASTRPQYYRIKRVVEMLHEGGQTGKWPNSGDFMRELEVSRRTVARDLDFLLDEENAPIAYNSARHGYHLGLAAMSPPTSRNGSGIRANNCRSWKMVVWKCGSRLPDARN